MISNRIKATGDHLNLILRTVNPIVRRKKVIARDLHRRRELAPPRGHAVIAAVEGGAAGAAALAQAMGGKAPVFRQS